MAVGRLGWSRGSEMYIKTFRQRIGKKYFLFDSSLMMIDNYEK